MSSLVMVGNGKKPARHVYKTGAAGCGGKAAPISAKNAGQVTFSVQKFQQLGFLLLLESCDRWI